jgi:hypothetical protein
VLLVPAGAAWLAALTRLNAAAQASAPRWVRARALAVYLLVFFGGMAAGSLLWGVVADRAGASVTLTASAAWLLIGLLAGLRFCLPLGEGTDLEPSRHWPEMAAMPGLERDRGPVLVTVEYRIDPARTGEFMDAVQPLGQARLRDGALWWEVFQDAADPAHLVESFLVEHLRQHERVTEADRVVQSRSGPSTGRMSRLRCPTSWRGSSSRGASPRAGRPGVARRIRLPDDRRCQVVPLGAGSRC